MNKLSLLATCAGAFFATASMAQRTADMAHSAPMVLQDPTRAPFVAVPGVPECVSMAPLRGNLGTESASAMVRMKTGCMVPFHWHTPSEELIVLRGAPLAQMQGERPAILKVGSYSQLPSKHVHRFRCESKEDCVLVLLTGGAFDIHFVDDAGEEISTDAALAAAAKTAHARW